MKLEYRNLKLDNRVLSCFLISIFLISALSAHAAIIPPCDPMPETPTSCGVNDLLKLLVNIYNFLLGLAGLVAMLFIVFGGVRMLYFSYLENQASELEAAKLTVSRAIGGLVIIALAYLLVNTALTMLGVARNSQVGELLIEWGLLQEEP